MLIKQLSNTLVLMYEIFFNKILDFYDKYADYYYILIVFMMFLGVLGGF